LPLQLSTTKVNGRLSKDTVVNFTQGTLTTVRANVPHKDRTAALLPNWGCANVSVVLNNDRFTCDTAHQQHPAVGKA